MDLASFRLGFVGAGRLGKSLAWACHAHGLRVSACASRKLADAQMLAEQVPGCAAVDAQAVVDHCDLVFITTPDAAIAPTVDSLRWRAGMRVVHCSGATEVAALASAERAGALTGGFHPLQTFGDPQVAACSLPGCTITIEALQPLDTELVALAQALGCPVNRLPPGARGLYHAAAGYASQFINVLMHEAAQMWQSWGASEDAAVRALLPLVQGTLASIAQSGPVAGMPGPVSRGDTVSVRKHVSALQAFEPVALDLYRELCSRTVQMARTQGRITGATAADLQAVLLPQPLERSLLSGGDTSSQGIEALAP